MSELDDDKSASAKWQFRKFEVSGSATDPALEVPDDFAAKVSKKLVFRLPDFQFEKSVFTAGDAEIDLDLQPGFGAKLGLQTFRIFNSKEDRMFDECDVDPAERVEIKEAFEAFVADVEWEDE